MRKTWHQTLWGRYIFCQLFRTFICFLSGFFLLYALVDFATHYQDFFAKGSLHTVKMLSYYAHQFTKRLLFLLPLSLLVATIQVLSALQTYKELIALQVSGIRLSQIIRPFFFLGIICSLLGYSNEEFFTPSLLAHIEHTSAQKQSRKPFTILNLDDTSKLIYQKIDREKKSFFDVYWICSWNEIWKMQFLQIKDSSMQGIYVDHFVRNALGFLEKQDSFPTYNFPSLRIPQERLSPKQTAARYQKISSLYSSLRETASSSVNFHREGEIKTYFTYKCLMPLLSFLVLFSVIPFCISNARTFSPFIIYSLALFGFVVFATLMNAFTILAENQICSPYFILVTPFLIVLCIAYGNFRRMLLR